MNVLSLLVALSCVAADDVHLQSNPVYREMRQPGVRVAVERSVPLPAPTLADGLDAAAAKAAITAIPDRHVPVDQLLRESVVAPMVLRFRDIDSKDPRVPVHGLDVWFVAYGELKMLMGKEFLESTYQRGQKDAKIHVLTAAELQLRQITPPGKDDENERYVFSVSPLMDRVQLSITTHSFVSRSDDSILAATVLDPRFAADKEFPNQWRPLERRTDGVMQLGPARPYQGAASYTKVTRLAEPRGALLVEGHLVFTEPKDWFHGANLLRSKLPILIQSEIRTFRRQLAEASK